MTVLIYGAGQLARMMALAAYPLGIHVQAVDVGSETVVDPISKEPLRFSLAEAIEAANVLTVEFEHVPEHLLEQAHQSGKLYPTIEAILAGADRVREKRLLESLGIANCPHAVITSVEQIDDAVKTLGQNLVLKASRDGYDGYGQWRITSPVDQIKVKEDVAALDLQAVPLVAEKMLQFDRELSLVGTRDKSGTISFYPLVDNLHYQGQLHLTIAPATEVTDALTQKAQAYFRKLVNELDYVGTLAVEMFQLGDELLVNEIAPRVHNSGHWSQQGADTSQFENHMRAICGLPLGTTEADKASAMVNIIGYSSFSRNMLSIPGCHLHWYGKSLREKRKMGHFNLTAKGYQALGASLLQLSNQLPKEHFPLLEERAQQLSTRTD